MRSGCIHDAMDKAQSGEMQLNAGLAKRAYEEWRAGDHRRDGGACPCRSDREVRETVRKASNAPLFVAGPLPTDIAVGHDHIGGCVGATIAAGAGADYLCYITPAEHLGLPSPEQVKEGLIAFRIAAHIGDSIKYGPDVRDRGALKEEGRSGLGGAVLLCARWGNSEGDGAEGRALYHVRGILRDKDDEESLTSPFLASNDGPAPCAANSAP